LVYIQDISEILETFTTIYVAVPQMASLFLDQVFLDSRNLESVSVD